MAALCYFISNNLLLTLIASVPAQPKLMSSTESISYSRVIGSLFTDFYNLSLTYFIYNNFLFMLFRRLAAARNSFFIRINFNFYLQTSTDCKLRLVLFTHFFYSLIEPSKFIKSLFLNEGFRDDRWIDFGDNGNSYIFAYCDLINSEMFKWFLSSYSGEH
jgi:hypothetical protein